MGTAQSATYGNHSLRMDLGRSIGMDRFTASSSDYTRQLAARNMPPQLKKLLAELFHRGAITWCSITFGTRLDLRLPRVDATGRTLLSGKALKQFETAFAEISGRQVSATWEATSGSGRGRGRSERDLGPLLNGIAGVFDAVCDGIVVAAAVDQLFGDRR